MFYAIRVTKPFNEISNFLDYIIERSDVVVVAEHSPATQTGNVVHCHIHCNASVGYHALRNRIKSSFTGNAEHSCKQTYKSGKSSLPIDEGNITYILKGKLEPSYVKGVSEQEINNLRCKWVPHVTSYVTATPYDGSGETIMTPSEVRVRDPALRTKMGVLERIADTMKTYSYDCYCWQCKSERQAGQSVFPVKWSLDKVHQNYRELSRVMNLVIFESGGRPNFQDCRTYIYCMYYTHIYDPEGWRTPDFIFESLHL